MPSHRPIPHARPIAAVPAPAFQDASVLAAEAVRATQRCMASPFPAQLEVELARLEDEIVHHLALLTQLQPRLTWLQRRKALLLAVRDLASEEPSHGAE
jgi:ArsR family metal-binding transcriptional regulator